MIFGSCWFLCFLQNVLANLKEISLTAMIKLIVSKCDDILCGGAMIFQVVLR